MYPGGLKKKKKGSWRSQVRASLEDEPEVIWGQGRATCGILCHPPAGTAPAPRSTVSRVFFHQCLLEYSWLQWNMAQNEEKGSRERTTAVQRALGSRQVLRFELLITRGCRGFEFQRHSQREEQLIEA